MHSNLKCYHLGYYINPFGSSVSPLRYAGWYSIVSFTEPVEIVRWLLKNADKVESIDFIAFKIF